MRTVRSSSHVYPSMHCPGGCMPQGVSAQGVSARGEDVYPSMHWGTDPPVDRILDTHLWKYYLAATLLRMVTRKQSSRVQSGRLPTVRAS